MATSRQSLIPNYLYTSSFSSPSNSFLTNNANNNKSMMTSSSPLKEMGNENKSFVIPAPSEPLGKIEMYSPQFYAACTVGGILSCGLTHMTVTPLDLVKCNMQKNAAPKQLVYAKKLELYLPQQQ